MKKNKISKNWINKQKRDIYVRKSKLEGYRSRAIYKLKEIDDEIKNLEEKIFDYDIILIMTNKDSRKFINPIINSIEKK